MGKEQSTLNHNNKYPSNDSIGISFKQSTPPDESKNFPPKKVDEIFLVHKRNIKKELRIGRKVYTFWGHEKIKVPKKVISHPDFENQRKYFLIKEE